jgi:type II secretory pathway pseudopilin PulG
MHLHRHSRRRRQGFTLIEALIATALVGFSLIVMFGFHSQAVRSNRHARKMTDCTYLAQSKLERLMSLPWDSTDRHDSLVDGSVDATAAGSNESLWAFLEHAESWSGGEPEPINAAQSSDDDYGEPTYYVSWDVADPTVIDDDIGATWTQLKVRCQYYDDTFNEWRGTTISSFRFRDA